MLPPRPIGDGESTRPPPEPPREDPRVWELHERLTRMETDRKWLFASLAVVVLLLVFAGPFSDRSEPFDEGERYRADLARIEARVSELDRDLTEMLAAVLEAEDDRRADAAGEPPEDSPVAAAPLDGLGPAEADAAPPPQIETTASEWAEAFGRRVLHGHLDDAERLALRRQWDSLHPVLRDQTLTAMLRRYGLDPEAFLAAIDQPEPKN